MTDEQKIKERLYQFTQAGLIDNDAEQVCACLSDRLMGIGIGEQGFVRSKQDIHAVVEAGQKPNRDLTYSIEYDWVEILIHDGKFASLCAGITVVSRKRGTGRAMRSKFLQSLTLLKEEDDWKICAMHATTPAVTEESMEAFPLKFAEKTLQSLREKMGEAAYQAEEQYRQAILADAVAFYIINFTEDIFEKCQLNCSWCLFVEAGYPYQQFIDEQVSKYLSEADAIEFLQRFSLDTVKKAFAEGKTELSFEYQMQQPSGQTVWVSTIVRLITDIVSGNQKGLMYVTDIDQQKREQMAMRDLATYDQMTGALNKATFTHQIAARLEQTGGVFVMLDIDNFKDINDQFGHPAGDEVLAMIGHELRRAFPEPTAIGRMGGDEFSVFVAGARLLPEMERRLEKLRGRIERITIPMHPALRTTCSIGAAYAPCHHSFSDTYNNADIALYRSKRNGKNQISFSK